MIRVDYKTDNATVLIVGGNSGIGGALIELLLAIGTTVISIDIQNNAVLSHEHLLYYQADPKNKSELEIVKAQLLKSQVSLYGLVNLSGAIKYFGPIETASKEEWSLTYDISFQSCLNSCQVFTALLDEEAKSSIVNMSSGLAFIGQKNYGPYSAAKAAIVSLTKTLAAELAPGIRVNSVAPGAVDTAFLKKEDGGTRVDIEKYKQLVPLGEIGKPEEIANVILYLLSEGASHITGECVHVNGGAS